MVKILIVEDDKDLNSVTCTNAIFQASAENGFFGRL